MVDFQTINSDTLFDYHPSNCPLFMSLNIKRAIVVYLLFTHEVLGHSRSLKIYGRSIPSLFPPTSVDPFSFTETPFYSLGSLFSHYRTLFKTDPHHSLGPFPFMGSSLLVGRVGVKVGVRKGKEDSSIFIDSSSTLQISGLCTFLYLQFLYNDLLFLVRLSDLLCTKVDIL